MAIDCGFGPDDLRRATMCLAAVSKDAEGELLAIDARPAARQRGAPGRRRP